MRNELERRCTFLSEVCAGGDDLELFYASLSVKRPTAPRNVSLVSSLEIELKDGCVQFATLCAEKFADNYSLFAENF